MTDPKDPTQLDRIECLLRDIRELLASQPGVPQRLWTDARRKAEAEMQARRLEIGRSYALGRGGIVLVNTPSSDGSYGPGGDGGGGMFGASGQGGGT